MLVACHELGGVELVVEVVGTHRVDEEAVGVVHEPLRRGEVDLGSVRAVVVI